MASEFMRFTKLVVGDLDRMAEFYGAIFGLKERARVDAVLEGRTVREVLFEDPPPGASKLILLCNLDRPSASTAGEVVIGVNTPDVAQFVVRARAAGAEVVSEILDRPNGVKIAFLRDPEGHLLQATQGL